MATNIIEMVLMLDDKASGKLKKSKKTIAKTAVAAGRLAGGMIAAAVAIGKMLQSMADAQNELTDMAARTGVTNKTLAGLKLAAEGSGQSMEDMKSVLEPMVERMAQAAQGSESAALGFSELGVSLEDDQGKMKSTDQVLREVTASLAGIPDASERARKASLAFGGAGTKLVQALGTSDLQAFVDMADEFGMDTGPAAVQAAADWERSMSQLKLVFQPFTSGLMAAVNKGIDNFTLGFIYVKTFIKTIWKAMVFDTKLAWAGMKFFLKASIEGWKAIFGGLSNAVKDIFKAMWEGIINTTGKALAKFTRILRKAVSKLDVTGRIPLPKAYNWKTYEMAAGKRWSANDADMPKAVDVNKIFEEVYGKGYTMEDVNPFDAAMRDAAKYFELNNKIKQSVDGTVGAFTPVTEAVEELGEEAEKTGKKIEKMAGTPWLDAQFAAAATPMLDRYKDSVQTMYEDMLDGIAVLAERDALKLDNRLANISRDFGAAETIVSGSTSGIASMVGMAVAGPAGAAVGGEIGKLIEMADEIDKNIEGLFGDIIDFLKDVPGAIMRVLSELIPKFIGELIPALLEFIPKLVVGFLMGIAEMFKNLWNSLKTMLNPFKSQPRAPGDNRGWWERTWDWATGTKPEGFASGGFVNQTGMAMVHQGERIIPSSGAGTGTATGLSDGGSGVSVTVNGIISPQLIDDLVRELNVALGPRGRGLALDGF